MHLPDERRSFLVTNLMIRMREIGYGNFQDYHDYVVAGGRGAVEWTVLVDRLTVHETRFFRHRPSLDMIGNMFLSEWMATSKPPYSFHVWSVACATGEEPYSLAMIVDNVMRGSGSTYYFGVLATDISLTALSCGRCGVYTPRKVTGVEPELLGRYFTKLEEGQYKVNDELRRRVCFSQLNVLDMCDAPIGKMDLIFCQNLLIYFDRDRRMQIVNDLVEHLLPGGLLVLGPGEILGWSHRELERVPGEEILAFRRRAAQAEHAAHKELHA